MAKDINWSYIFGGIAAVAGIVALYRVNGNAPAAGTTNVFPALNEQAMAGPSVPGYNVPTLAPASQPTNTATPPSYMSNNQMTSRKRHYHAKWQKWRQQAKQTADTCCGSCSSDSAPSSSKKCPNDNSAITGANFYDLIGAAYNVVQAPKHYRTCTATDVTGCGDIDEGDLYDTAPGTV